MLILIYLPLCYYVSSYCYICVLILLCVVILLHMCPHTTAKIRRREMDKALILLFRVCVLILLYVYSYYYMCPHTTMYLSSYN